MKPRFAVAALNLSVALAFSQNAPGDLLESYRQELQTHPRSSLAHYRLGEILAGQQHFQEAANEFRAALEADLEPPWVEGAAHASLGKIFERNGQADRAMREYVVTRHLSEDKKVLIAGPPPLRTREPDYSEEARIARLEGTVVLSGTIADDGSVRELRVARPLGLGLDEKAIEAAGAWRFAPGAYQDLASVNFPVDFLLPAKQSRWHLIRTEFRPPAGASRPVFLSAKYPAGSGIMGTALEEARIVAAVGRQARVRLSFDIDEQGIPANFRVTNASQEVWGSQAIALVDGWRFKPGMKNGSSISVPCTFDLVWGQRDLTAEAIARLRAAADSPEPSSPSIPAPIYRTEPVYSDEARNARLEGAVIVSLIVNEDGTPGEVRIVKPLGLGLDEKAAEAVAQWRFLPPTLNGHPAPIPMVVQVDFRLPPDQTRR